MSRTSECLVVGHRGFKAKYTENTLFGFGKCYDAGAIAFETDIWTTIDEVLVISHDVNTKRVFCDANGNEADHNILESYYDEIKDLRTIKSGELLLTFKGLLSWFRKYVELQEDTGESHRIMLDLKDANPPKLLRLIVRDMLEVHDDLLWWLPRIQLGLWNLRFVKFLNQDPFFQSVFLNVNPSQLSQFDLLHISLSWEDSLTYLAYNEYLDALPDNRVKFKITTVSMIYIATWSPGFQTKFMPALRKQNLKFYSWTINTRPQLEYFCAFNGFYNVREYGVITDWPDRLVAFVGDVEHEQSKAGNENLALLRSQRPKIPFRFRLCHLLYSGFKFWAGLKRPHPDFEAHTDPEEMHAVPPGLIRQFFALLQHWGIF